MSRVTEPPAADPLGACAHFEGLLVFETDCWGLVKKMIGGIEGWKDERFPLTTD